MWKDVECICCGFMHFNILPVIRGTWVIYRHSQLLIHEWTWCVSGGMTMRGKTEFLGEVTVSVSICPPQIWHRLAWYWTRVSAAIKCQLPTLDLITEDGKGDTYLVQSGKGTRMRISVKCIKRRDMYIFLQNILIWYSFACKTFSITSDDE